jgi:hypothetical protein
MKRRRLTMHSKRQRALRLALTLMGGSVLIVAALFVMRLVLPAPPELDETTLCPMDGKPLGHTLVLVDKTDFHTPQHVAAIKDWIGRKKAAVGDHEMLSLRLITDRPEDAGRPLFSRCNPGDGKGMSSRWSNPRRAWERWRPSFGEPLEQALGGILRHQQAKVSPILESIDVALWDTSFSPDLPSRTLVIVSDMVQNMPGHSHYRAIPSVDAFLKTPLGRRLQTRAWRGVRVEIVYLRNVAGLGALQSASGGAQGRARGAAMSRTSPTSWSIRKGPRIVAITGTRRHTRS